MDIEQVRKLAQLARLEVPEAELASVATEMGAILGFVDEIQKVQIEHTQNTAKELNFFREDRVAPISPAHDLVEASAMHQDHFIKVPKVLGE